MPLLLEIVTPEKKVYSNSVDAVVLPTDSGEVGILPGHIPLLVLLQPGELQVTLGTQTEYLAVDKGFAQVHADRVSVLTEQAIQVEEIDFGAMESARARAEEALAEARRKGEDPALVEEAERVLRFAVTAKLIREKRRN